MKEKKDNEIDLNPILLKKIKGHNIETQMNNAIEFLIPERIDLIAKYLYVKYYIEGIKSDFAKELYLKHIEVFNGFYEADGSYKIGKQDFLNSFNTLIDSIKVNGFDKSSVIPFNLEGIILDGAHRVAISMFLNIPIVTSNLKIPSKKFDYKFFERLGLNSVYLDTMALEYLNLKRHNLHLVFIWPTSGGGKKDALNKILEANGKIVYRKGLYLNTNGAVNLIRKIYKKESWLGDYKDGFIGARNKANWCFEGNFPVDVILFESDSDMIAMKDEIRNLFKVNKHSVHITDTIEEVGELGKLIFNDNSIKWLNLSNIKKFTWFDKLFNHYKNWITANELNPEDFCIDGSATLSAFGQREARDLDFLYSGFDNVSTGYKEIDCHNIRLNNDKQLIDDIVYDPRNHFYFDSIKFLSLELLLVYKIKRNEGKDHEDVKLIENIKSGNKKNIPLREQILKVMKLSYWKGRIKFYLLKFRYNLVKIINEIKG